jgi:hypothetical protein
MLATDLRIGNIIEFEDESFDRVRVEGIYKIDETWFVDWTKLSGTGSFDKGDSILDDFLPIPLTIEILEKCGFILESESLYRLINSDISRIDRLYVQDVSDEERPNMKLDCILDPSTLKIRRIGIHNFSYSNMTGRQGTPIDIRFLHQLQNLYYVLTREELEVKL